MRILVTGSSGKVGKAVVETLDTAGHEVVTFDLEDGFDVADGLRLDAEMKGCEQVIHLAAIPYPDWDRPVADFFQVNVVGTFNVLETASTLGVRRFIYASSGSVYGWDALPSPKLSSNVIEEDRIPVIMGPRPKVSSYGTSKRMAEELCRYYGTNTEMEVLVLRIAPVDDVRRDIFYMARARAPFLARVFSALVAYPYGNEMFQFLILNVAEPDDGLEYNIARLMEFL